MCAHQVAATIARGLLKRSFLEWRRLAEERWWKNQYVMREREIQLLEAKIRGYERRPIQVRQADAPETMYVLNTQVI